MKNNKGITLIALVITIIVMLILVVVTINIAKNGGLFDSARKAGSDTQIESEREELLSYTYGDAYDAISGTLNLNKLETKLNDSNGRWNVIEKNDKYLKVQNVKSENQYKIYGNTTIEFVNPETGSTNTPNYVEFTSGMDTQKYAKITINKNIKFIANSANIDRLKDDKEEFITDGFDILDENKDRIYSLKVQEDETFEYTLYLSDDEGDNSWIYYPNTIGEKTQGWYYDGMSGEETLENHPLPEIDNCYFYTEDPDWTQAMCSDLLIIEE